MKVIVERLEMAIVGRCLEQIWFNETYFCSNPTAVEESHAEYVFQHTNNLVIFYEKTEVELGGHYWLNIKGNTIGGTCFNKIILPKICSIYNVNMSIA